MIKSWDCFDTLISRYYHYPLSIFRLIQDQTKDDNFITKRTNAEKISEKKTLEDIYKNLPGHDIDLELELEKQYSYPILENFTKIQDGDIVVSDMYLSSEQILDILHHHGLNKDITVYSTYGKKANGSIWHDLKQKHNISCHTGDNLHSDVKQARFNNLNGIYYGGSFLTNQEKLIERYSPYLAYWIKYIRLNNPYFVPYQRILFDKGSISYYYSLFWIKEYEGEIYILEQIQQNDKQIVLRNRFNDEVVILYKDIDKITIINESSSNYKDLAAAWQEQPVNTNRFDEHILWTEQCSYNIPLLINSSYLLPKKIVFSYRDCYYWKKIYDSIFETNIDILESCRNSYYYPYSQEYIDYVLRITKEKTIVDLHGTGYSSGHFFSNQNRKQDILFISEHSDNVNKNISIKNLAMCFDRIFKEDPVSTRFNHSRIASKNGLRCCSGTMLEKFNIPPNLGQMVGWGDQCIRKKPEHNQDICNIFNNVVICATSKSGVYSSYINAVEDLTEILLKRMNEDNYANTVIHSLWDPIKHIKLL